MTNEQKGSLTVNQFLDKKVRGSIKPCEVEVTICRLSLTKPDEFEIVENGEQIHVFDWIREEAYNRGVRPNYFPKRTHEGD